MQTSKPFSTISYNSESFLKAKLNELVNRGVLDFWSAIYHKPEEDELKGHFHVFFRPAERIKTDSIKEFMREPVAGSDKPLGCTIFIGSKFDDWYLYACHDRAYLASKGQSRKHHYSISQFLCSDDDVFAEFIRCIDRSKFIGMERIINAVQNDVSFAELLRLGGVPIQLLGQYERAYMLLKGNNCVRNGRISHSPNKKPFLIDEETGEIIKTDC